MDATDRALDRVFGLTTLDCVYSFVVVLIFGFLNKYVHGLVAFLVAYVLFSFKWFYVDGLIQNAFKAGQKSGNY